MNVTFLRFLQPAKAYLPNTLSEAGRTIEVMPVPKNAYAPMLSKTELSEKLTSFKAEIPSNALSPILLTEEGIVILRPSASSSASLKAPLNAFFPIDARLLPLIVREVSFSQFSKA